MALTIDELEIKIQSDAAKASGGIDALVKSMGELKSAIGGASGLASNLTQIANAMQNYNAVGKMNLKSKINQLSALKDLVPVLGGGEATQLAHNLRDIASAMTDFSAVPKLNVNVSSLSNGIKTLNEATASFDSARLREFSTQMAGIAGGLSHLNSVGKTNISSIVSSLKKIPEITKSLDPATVEEFAKVIERLTAVMTPLGVQMDAVARGFNSLPKSILRALNATSSYTRANNKCKSSCGGLFTSLSRTAARFWTLYYSVSRVVDLFADWFTTSNEYIESLNLFNVSLGDAAESALEYAEAVSEAMGIDVAEWITNQGVFTRMATGFGIASDSATLMGQNLTQLAYDMSSFFNTDVETAMQKLQSGMSGQIKGLKAWGYNLSVAALEETALSLGIDQKVRSMTEAQKAQLRYITLIQKSNGIMGDMAKTITSPSNAMRILTAQMKQMERALGNVVSVLITKFIPYVMAGTELITECAEALAKVWGFEVMEFPQVDLDLGAEIEEETEQGEDAIKELKRQLMGFDELNILKSDKDDEDTTPKYDLGIALPEYDFLKGLEGLDLEPYKEKLKDILAIVTQIGIAFATWKIGSSLFNALSGGGLLGGLLSNSATLADKLQVVGGAIGVIAGSITELWGVIDALKEGFDVSNIAATTLGTAGVISGGALIGAKVGTAVGGVAGGAIVSGLIMAIASGIDAFVSGPDLENMILTPIGTTLAGAGIGFFIGGPIGALIGAGIGLAVGGVVDGIAALVDYFSSDAIEAIEIFDKTISQTTREKVEPFVEKMRELSDLSFNLEIKGEIISDDIIANVETKVSEIVNIITNELDADKNEVLKTIDPIKGFLSEADFSGIQTSISEFYAEEQTKAQEYQNRISEIMKTAADEKRALTTAEWSEINSIQSEMQDMGVLHLSETMVEYETIMRNLKDNASHISLEQASAIIKDAQATRDEAILAAENQYSAVLLEAQQMFDVGAINKEQYDAIVSAAEQAKKDAIDEANAQYNGIYDAATNKLGELARYIDENTGDIKSKWTVFWEDVGQSFKNGWNDVCTWWDDNIVKWWNESVAPWFTKEKWQGLWDGLVSWFKGLEFPEINIKTPHFEWTSEPVGGWMGNALSAIGLEPQLPKLNVEWYASGGFPNMGEMFIAREAGPELVGRIGNKNAVVNNQQIISGIASAVYGAMMAAHEDSNTGGGSNARIVVQIGDRAVGEAAVSFINGQIIQTGVNPIHA